MLPQSSPSHDPTPIAGQARRRRAVGEHDRSAARVEIDQALEELPRIARDQRQFLMRGRESADVVRRPASFEGGDVAQQMVTRGPDELHREILSEIGHRSSAINRPWAVGDRTSDRQWQSAIRDRPPDPGPRTPNPEPFRMWHASNLPGCSAGCFRRWHVRCPGGSDLRSHLSAQARRGRVRVCAHRAGRQGARVRVGDARIRTAWASRRRDDRRSPDSKHVVFAEPGIDAYWSNDGTADDLSRASGRRQRAASGTIPAARSRATSRRTTSATTTAGPCTTARI